MSSFMSEEGTPARSLLFCPGDRPDRFDKAVATGSDLVCLDLEDAVAPDRKAAAREEVLRFLSRSAVDRGRVAVRVNALGSEAGRADIEALDRCLRPREGRTALTLLVPKAEGGRALDELSARFGDAGVDARVIAMIETARGLTRADEVASADGVTGVLFGAVDLAAELGCGGSWDALLYARSRIVHAAAIARVEAIDVPSLELSAFDRLEEETRAVAELGFTGKAAIHPAQIPPIHRALTPTAQEVESARDTIDAYDEAGGGVVRVDGRMIDVPVVLKARRLLARAEAYGV